MAFLLDTDILSVIRRPDRIDPKLIAWFMALSSNELFLSTMSIGEIERGITKQRNLNPDFAEDLHDWLEQLLLHYSDRIIPVNVSIARRWGKLSQRIGNSNIDILIASTAIEYGLTVATRNVSHFMPTGVNVFNPFDDASA